MQERKIEVPAAWAEYGDEYLGVIRVTNPVEADWTFRLHLGLRMADTLRAEWIQGLPKEDQDTELARDMEKARTEFDARASRLWSEIRFGGVA